MTTPRVRPQPDGQAVRPRRRVWRVLAWIASILAAAGVVAGAVWLVWYSPYLVVASVRVTGNPTVGAESIAAAAAGSVGKPLVSLDVDAVTSAVLADPRVDAVEVTRQWPDTVSIRVVERTPVAVVATGTGWAVLDAEGVAFIESRSRPAGLVRVNATGNGLLAALRVADDLPPELSTTVDVITASTRDDVRLALRRAGRPVTVIWGSAERTADKSQVLVALLGIDATTYDVSAPDRPATLAGAS